MLDLIKKTLHSWYIQYELITCIYIFEPWEKLFLNGSVFVIFLLICYSSIVYLPTYTASLLQEGKKMLGI